MWDFIKNMIPWYVYAIGIAVIGGTLWVFFGPTLLVIWRILPNWTKYVIGLLLAVGLAIVFGRNRGFRDAKEMQKRLDERAVGVRQETHDEVQKLDVRAVDKRLDKWMRD